jgi:hypothetical protein
VKTAKPFNPNFDEAVATAEPQRHGTIKLRIKGLHPLHDEYGTFELEGFRRIEVNLDSLSEQLDGFFGDRESSRLCEEIWELVQRRAIVLALAERTQVIS